MRSVVLLAGVIAAILCPVFIGHAFSTHESGPVVWGLIMAGVGAILLAVGMCLPVPQSGGH